MTVCIAATYRHDFSDLRRYGFILCTDGRLDEGEWGYSDTAIKVHCVGHNCFALMSGEWHTVRELCAALESHERKLFMFSNTEELLERTQAAMGRFSESSLCKAKVDIVLTGFVGHVPVMLRGEVAPNESSVGVSHDFDAIGEGSFASLMMLRHRGYDALNIGLERAVYTIYEAKKFSESVSSVGPKTRITLHWPMPHPGIQWGEDHLAADDYNYRDLNESAIAQLEGLRRRFFIQAIGDFKFAHPFIDPGG